MVTSPVRRQDIHRFTPRHHLHKSSTYGMLTDLPLTLPKTPLFGTDGIRGRVGELLTAELARQIGFWAGQVLHSVASALGPVIVGQDSRNSSDILASALSQGLNLAGLEVWNIGLCPTPGVAYLTRFSEAIGGVMISASHNPPEDNGIKFFSAQGTKLPGELQQQIEAGIRGIVDKAVVAHTQGQHYHRPELVGRYLDSLRRPLQSGTHLQGMKIVLDLAWGASVRLAEQVFSELGATVICLHNQPDGDRINVNCGSTHLACLQKAVREQSADMGFAFDGDADRVMAVDSEGRIIDGDYILYFWGQTLRQTDQLPDDLIVATVMANLGFERAWKASGGKLVRTAVGDQYVQAAMDRSGAMLGGEQSGHILCYHYGLTGDGMLTALHLASLVRQSGVSLKTLVDQSFQTYPQLLQNVRVENRDRRLHWQDCQPLMDAISQAQTVMADQGRVLVRASGTEPVIRVMVEAIEAQMATHWTDKLVSVVEQHLS